MSRLGRRLLPVAVAALAFATFLPALEGRFLNWDDKVNFVGNPGYRGLGWAHLHWMLTATLMGHWIPLTWLSLGINYALGGMDPWGYHLGNLLLHAANAALFYLAARRLLAAAWTGGDQARADDPRFAWGAALAASLFAVHPLRAESVAWVTERRDVLSGLFFLASGLAYLRGVGGGGPIQPRWKWASVAALALALLCKATVVPLPLVLLLLDVYPLRRAALGWRRLLAEKAPQLVLAAAATLVGLWALPSAGVVTPYDRYGPGARVAMVAWSLLFYPWKFLWPSGLMPLYELPPQVDPLAWPFLPLILGAAGVTVLLLLLRARWPAGLAAWTYSALMLAPVSGIVHAGHQLAHDRYSYLSGLSLALLSGAALAWLVGLRAEGRVGRPVAAAAGAGAALLAAGLAVGASEQSRVWRDSETLWTWAVNMDPACTVCKLNLGEALLSDPVGRAARLGEAEGYFREALALRPDYAQAHYNLGTVLLVRRRWAEAEEALRTYMRLAPGAPAGPERLGLLYLLQGRHEEALPLLRQAAVMRGRGGAAEMPPAPESASEAQRFARAVALLSDEPEALEYLGRTLVAEGRAALGVLPLERAAALDPGAPAARFWLARAWLDLGHPERAAPHAAALLRLDPLLADELRALGVPRPGGHR